MPWRATSTPSFTFWLKALLALALVILADRLLYGVAPGSVLGAFALAWLVAVFAVHPALRRDPRAVKIAGLAAALILVLLDHPTLLAWVLFWLALSSAVLLSRSRRFDDAWRWSRQLAFFAAAGAVGAALDLYRIGAVRRRGAPHRRDFRAWTGIVALPLVGGALFLWLFAMANPLIERFFTHLYWPADFLTAARLMFWLAVLATVWAAFRPRLCRKRKSMAVKAKPLLLPPQTLSVASALVVFNLLFALQNGLDIAFLWSGAALPTGVTLAGYAHRGAYLLIVTALLAGLFVLVALAPGSETSQRPTVRRLVVLWVAQNVFLVVSSILRTLDYIDAYSLTRFRIAALVWMALVALGLVLICWRMLRGRSAAWLINTNAAVALTVLTLASVLDLGSFAASWNVRHAREVGGRGAQLDLCYLAGLDDSSLAALSELEQTRTSSELHDRVVAVRSTLLGRLQTRQDDWRRWTVRGALRLGRAQSTTGAQDAAIGLAPGERDCNGRLIEPPIPAPPPAQATTPVVPEPVAPPAAPALTSEARP